MKDTKQNGLSASLEVSNDGLQSLTEIAQQVRRDVVSMIQSAKTGHLGPSLSCVEVLVSLYFDRMNHKPDEPN
jgi:transketolase